MENEIQKYSLGKKIGIIFLGIILYSFIIIIFSAIYLYLIILFNIKGLSILNFLNEDIIFIIYFILTIFLGFFIFKKYIKNQSLYRKLLFVGFVVSFIIFNFFVYSILHCSCKS